MPLFLCPFTTVKLARTVSALGLAGSSSCTAAPQVTSTSKLQPDLSSSYTILNDFSANSSYQIRLPEPA